MTAMETSEQTSASTSTSPWYDFRSSGIGGGGADGDPRASSADAGDGRVDDGLLHPRGGGPRKRRRGGCGVGLLLEAARRRRRHSIDRHDREGEPDGVVVVAVEGVSSSSGGSRVALAGPRGCGRTSLAMDAAHRLLPRRVRARDDGGLGLGLNRSHHSPPRGGHADADADADADGGGEFDGDGIPATGGADGVKKRALRDDGDDVDRGDTSADASPSADIVPIVVFIRHESLRKVPFFPLRCRPRRGRDDDEKRGRDREDARSPAADFVQTGGPSPTTVAAGNFGYDEDCGGWDEDALRRVRILYVPDSTELVRTLSSLQREVTGRDNCEIRGVVLDDLDRFLVPPPPKRGGGVVVGEDHSPPSIPPTEVDEEGPPPPPSPSASAFGPAQMMKLLQIVALLADTADFLEHWQRRRRRRRRLPSRPRPGEVGAEAGGCDDDRMGGEKDGADPPDEARTTGGSRGAPRRPRGNDDDDDAHAGDAAVHVVVTLDSRYLDATGGCLVKSALSRYLPTVATAVAACGGGENGSAEVPGEDRYSSWDLEMEDGYSSNGGCGHPVGGGVGVGAGGTKARDVVASYRLCGGGEAFFDDGVHMGEESSSFDGLVWTLNDRR